MIDPQRVRRTAAALLLAGASGCAAARQDFVSLNAGTTFASRPSDAPVILSVGDFDRSYHELGVIHVSGVTRQGYEGLNAKMRAKAREVGADAVIFVNYGTENVMSIVPFFVAIPYDVLTAQGIAVRSTASAGAPQDDGVSYSTGPATPAGTQASAR